MLALAYPRWRYRWLAVGGSTAPPTTAVQGAPSDEMEDSSSCDAHGVWYITLVGSVCRSGFDVAIVAGLTLSYCICPAMHYQLCSSLMKGLSFRCCRVVHSPVTAMQC